MFYEKNHAENLHQKLVLDPFLILVNNPKQPLHESFKYKIIKKALKKPFLSNSVPFNGHDYEKQKGPGTSDQSLFWIWNKFRKIPLLVMYYLSKFDGVIESGSRVIPKLTPANLCKPIHDIINYSTFICHFESGKWEGRKKITIIWMSQEQKDLFTVRSARTTICQTTTCLAQPATTLFVS